MPPSPSLRCSPSRDKKGRSLESGLSLKEKDDDLALFNQVQSKEQDNFLLQSTDDFEDILCNRRCLLCIAYLLAILLIVLCLFQLLDVSATKFKSLPDLNLGIAARGESSDLLNVDEDKNDYEWLVMLLNIYYWHPLNDSTPLQFSHSF